ncbi:hypothetical protein Csa_015934 [Cucumis sativus]|uniref:Uncharacterized protein n=1 Tax=Cucumis sativus TaxID=3659 RepID=A0A0A0K896_CUCSA|nr:hypothetical protein Csa_015934 [Cucumis sativus]
MICTRLNCAWWETLESDELRWLTTRDGGECCVDEDETNGSRMENLSLTGVRQTLRLRGRPERDATKTMKMERLRGR